MNKEKNKTYENTNVLLDGKIFENCTFINCTLQYSGTDTVQLSGCNFGNPKWVFTGAAGNTLNFLHGVYHGMGDGGKKLVNDTFNNIKNK